MTAETDEQSINAPKNTVTHFAAHMHGNEHSLILHTAP
jgi:hypothetical protein